MNTITNATTVHLADQLAAALQHTIRAHSHFPHTPRDAVRLWDNHTPYAIHPIWCAMTLLTETTLPQDIRYHGYLALLWHDTLEDTTLPLPNDIHPAVRQLVEEMTFANLDDEFVQVWTRSDTTKLLKLYDKVSQFLDGVWLRDVRWNQLLSHTHKLQTFVEATYGELNIVKIARAVCQPRS
jgi:hypothetical protein